MVHVYSAPYSLLDICIARVALRVLLGRKSYQGKVTLEQYLWWYIRFYCLKFYLGKVIWDHPKCSCVDTIFLHQHVGNEIEFLLPKVTHYLDFNQTLTSLLQYTVFTPFHLSISPIIPFLSCLLFADHGGGRYRQLQVWWENWAQLIFRRNVRRWKWPTVLVQCWRKSWCGDRPGDVP